MEYWRFVYLSQKTIGKYKLHLYILSAGINSRNYILFWQNVNKISHKSTQLKRQTLKKDGTNSENWLISLICHEHINPKANAKRCYGATKEKNRWTRTNILILLNSFDDDMPEM